MKANRAKSYTQPINQSNRINKTNSTGKLINNSIKQPKNHGNSSKMGRHIFKYSIFTLLAIIFITLCWYFIPWDKLSSWIDSFNNDQFNQKITLLEKSIEQNNRNQQVKLSAITQLLEQHNEEQEQKILLLTRQLYNFENLLNRWKDRLADPDLLIDNIYNHINLVNSLALLNYSPSLLIKQLQTVDQLAGELNDEKMATLRLELQQTIRQLDIKSSDPIDQWLKEIREIENSIPLWLEQNYEAEFSNDNNPSPITLNNNNDVFTNNSENKPNDNGWLNSIATSMQNLLGDSVKIQKTNEKKLTKAKSLLNIEKQLLTRLEYLKLSILSRNWDSLRQQSLELSIWLERNFPNGYNNIRDLLANMSQYKPSVVQISLSRALKLVDDYKKQLKQEQSIHSTNPSAHTQSTTQP